MIRTVITPDQQHISISLPKKFIGKLVEIIAFTIDEPDTQVKDKTRTHLASEQVLAKDWNTTEEDQAWKDL
jgi:hypothetical protein